MDIDKLYLSTYYFRNKDGNMVREFDEGSKENLANQLLDHYLTLLEDCGRQVNKGELSKARYTQYLRRSIDNDTALVDSVLAKIRANDIHPIYESMQYGSLSTQTNVKDQFITGKKGIGPFALNNNSQILTQLFKVSFDKKGGLLSDLNLNSLHDYIDRDGNSIQSWLSAMINVHVDVAKDPKVRPLNINQYTYNLLNLLLRIGLGQDSLYFITQPIVRELAETSNQNDGYIVENPGLSKSQRQKSAEAMLLHNTHFQDSDINAAIDMINRRYLPNDLKPKLDGEKYSDRVKSVFNRYRPLIRQLFMINEDGQYHRAFQKLVDGKWQKIEGVSIFEDIMTSNDVLTDPNAPRSISNLKTQSLYKINGEYLSPNDVQGLVYIAKAELDKYAQALSNLVKYTKIDTKKQGKNINEQSKYRKEYLTMRENLGNGYFDSKLLEMLDYSFIDKKTRMGTSMLQDVLASEVIRATKTFNGTVINIEHDMNQHSDASLAAIRKGVMAAIKQKAMNYVMAMNNVQWMDMITGPNTLSMRIQKLRSKMLADPKTYSDFVTNGNISNRLLDAIRPVPYTPSYGSVRYDIITLDNIESDDTCTQNDYIDAWQQLLDSEDEEIRQIGNDLAIYAFMTSADTAGSTKFFKYVPISWRIDFGYDSAISAAYDEYANPHMHHENTFRINTDDFIKDNWLNNAIVPLTQQMVARPATQEEILNGYTNTGIIYEQNFVSVNLKYKDINRSPGHEGEFVEQQIPYMIAGVKYGNNYARATISPDSEGNFPAYIKIRRQGSSHQDTDAYLLYRLVKRVSRTIIGKDGAMREVRYPVYLLDKPSGARIYALGQTFQFYGYGRGSEYSHLPEIEHPTEKDFLNLENFFGLSPLNPDHVADIESYDEWVSDIIDGNNSNFVGDAVKVMQDVKTNNDNKTIKPSDLESIPFYSEASSTEDSQRLENSAKQMLDDAELGSSRKDTIKNIFGSEAPYREEPYKTSQLLQNIINTTQYPSIKKIAELLLVLSKGDNDFDIIVREHLGKYNASGEAYQSTNKFGSYININFLTPAFIEHPEHVILHEIVHLNTLALMKGDKALYDAIQNYMNYVRDHLSESQKSEFQYALLDPFEFVAEVYSRPMLQAALKKIPAMEKNKFANMFDQIVDAIKQAIRRILNKSEYPTSALDQIMPIINSIIATQYSADNNVATIVEHNSQIDSRLAENMSANNVAVANEIAQIIQDDRKVQRSEYEQYYKDAEQLFYDMMSEQDNVDLYDMSPQMMPLSTTQSRKAVADRLNNRWKDDIYRNWNSIDKGWENYNDFKNGTIAEENRSQLLHNTLQNIANSLSKVGIKVSITYNSNNGYKISSTTNSDIVSGKNADMIYNMLYQQLTKNHPWYSINPQAKSQININLRSKSWFDELVKERQISEEEENATLIEDTRESLQNMYSDGLIEQIKDMAPFGYNYSDEEINNMSYEEIAEKLFGC